MDKKESLSDLSSKISNSSTEMVVMTDNIGVEQVNALFLKGHKIFGSSNLADLMSKVEICDKSITWYYFGEFESKDVYNLLKVKNIKYLASISNLEVAQKTSNTCEKMSMMRSVFIKVNFGQDSSGCNYEKCLDFYSEVYDHCPYIAIEGLMTNSHSKEEFEKMKDLKKQIEKKNSSQDELRLCFGEYQDYDIAINSGSNIIRIDGSIIN